MFHVTRIDETENVLPAAYTDRSRGFSRQQLVGKSQGSPHMGLYVCRLEPDGHVEAVVHSYEISLYVLSGELVLTMLGQSITLPADHCAAVPVGVTYSVRASGRGPVSWLHMAAPAPFEDTRRKDTFFTGEQLEDSAVAAADVRDPRNQSSFRFDAASMDLDNLAVGSKVDAPQVSASMATALLAYSGIGVRMLVDQRLKAQLHTMFMVQYQPTAIAHPHDHPFEEAYVMVEGEVHALVEGHELVLRPGDVLWAGVGADHGFHNRGNGLVRWIETQAPQPPAQHSYRFNRDWEYLEKLLDAGE
ncbi:MAG: cupin domain-containing protein [Candidatus Nanopelagicales bacterium]